MIEPCVLLGIHARKSGHNAESESAHSMTAAVKEAVELVHNYGVTRAAVQFFSSGPRNFKPNFDEDDAVELAHYISTSGVAAVIHGSYADNPWEPNHNAAMIHNI